MSTNARLILWFSVFACLNFLYIGYEFSFNAQLVDVAGNIYIDSDRLHRLEMTSRLLSGIGLALSLIGWLRLHHFEFSRAVPLFFVTFLVCIPLMYQLQSKLVNYLVEDYFSSADRQTAQYASLLKSGIEHDNLRLAGVEFDSKLKDEPEQNTFLALIGGVVFNSPGLMEQLKENRKEIASVFVHNYVVDHEEEYWQKYQETYQVLQQQWPAYQQATSRYINEMNNMGDDVDKIWLSVNEELVNGWENYKRAVRDLALNLHERLPDLTTKLNEYFAERLNCYLEDCYKTLDSAYHTKIVEFMGREIDPQYWLTEKDDIWQRRHCRQQDEELVCDNTSLEITASQGWFDEGEQYVWDPSPEAMLPKLLLLSEAEFLKVSGGYGVSLNSREAFIAHPQTAALLRQRLSEQGITLPISWRITKDRIFVEAVQTAIAKKIRHAWDNEMILKLGYVIEPNLKFNEFMNTAYVQKRMREIMGEYYVSGVRPNFTRKEFYQKLLLPLVHRYTEKMAEQLNAKTVDFSNGGPYAERAKQYLRLLVIPPVAMFFSLFFGTIAVVKLPVLLLTVYGAWRRHQYVQIVQKYKSGFFMIMTVILLLLPTQFISNKFSAKNSGFQALLNDVKHTQPILGFGMEWMIRIQPLAYPFGSKINEVFHHGRGAT